MNKTDAKIWAAAWAILRENGLANIDERTQRFAILLARMNRESKPSEIAARYLEELRAKIRVDYELDQPRTPTEGA